MHATVTEVCRVMVRFRNSMLFVSRENQGINSNEHSYYCANADKKEALYY